MKTVIGLVKDKREAKATIDELKRVGATEADISVVSPDNVGDLGGVHLEPMNISGVGRLAAGGPLTTFLHTSAAESSPDALVSALMRLGVAEREATRYVDGVRRGCTLETVSVEDDKADEALAIMKRHAVGLDGAPRKGGKLRSASDRDWDGEANWGTADAIPLAKEELEVGTRRVEAGGVRVDTHVESVPVEQDVQLRDERIDVERRPVDRDAGNDAFREQHIEMTATTEKPVVQKRARVIEEIALRKDVDQHTETVRDEVREMKADVDRFDASQYRDHYESSRTDDDYDFDSYQPAYRFGSELRTDERYGGSDWNEVEPRARSTWEERNPGTWERFKNAVKHAWDRTVR
jgi:uncharacterized protein (TIGR02271 family)